MDPTASLRILYPTTTGAGFLVRETASPAPTQPRLLDRVRAVIRARHYSRRTEKAYVAWITQFLSALVVDRNVAASTQNQALSAILFLYRDVLEQDLPWLDDIVRSKRAARLPVVLRVKDVDFARNEITVRAGKGDKDRVTMLPAAVKDALAKHLEIVKRQHEFDLAHGAGWVELPWALARKYPNAGRDGPGSGSSRRLGSTSTRVPGSTAATISTSRSCRVRSGMP